MRAQAAPRALAPFLARVFLWGVLAFVAWHAAARPLSLACGWLGARVVELAAPVDSVRVDFREGELVLAVVPDYETVRRGDLAPGSDLELRSTALMFSFGLPFFLALMLASRPDGLRWKAPLGAATIVALAGASVGVDALAQAAALRLPSGVPLFAFAGANRELIALGYQLGTLIIPPVAPVMLWMGLDWRAMQALAGLRA